MCKEGVYTLSVCVSSVRNLFEKTQHEVKQVSWLYAHLQLRGNTNVWLCEHHLIWTLPPADAASLPAVPSWYWTTVCIASSSLSTRSFQALLRESHAEFSYNVNIRTLSVSYSRFSTTIKHALISKILLKPSDKLGNMGAVPHLYFLTMGLSGSPHAAARFRTEVNNHVSSSCNPSISSLMT